jgi:4-carboxymuconolactone decarboxylase
MDGVTLDRCQGSSRESASMNDKFPQGRDPTPGAGAARRERVQGPKSAALQRAVAALDPDVAEWVDEFVFGTVWERPGLSEEERTLVAISALAATEHPNQLRAYLFGALHAGVSAKKIHEALVMMVVYAGFPAALGGLTVWREVIDAARRAGVTVDI